MWYGKFRQSGTCSRTGNWDGASDTSTRDTNFSNDVSYSDKFLSEHDRDKVDNSDNVLVVKKCRKFGEKLSGILPLVPKVLLMIGFVLARKVDKHCGGFQRNKKHYTWSGVNFQKCYMRG